MNLLTFIIFLIFFFIIFILFDNKETFNNYLSNRPTKCFSCEKEMPNIAHGTKCFSCER